ncbi:MAG: hypothetical protein V1744_05175 [Candidatus Altiarchaeota archaeon]
MEKTAPEDTLETIRLAVGEEEYSNALKFAEHIRNAAKRRDLTLGDTNILVGYGGGKDSTWSLTFTRLAQLICAKECGETFNLQVVTMVHLGTSKGILDNIDLVYSFLGVKGDADRVQCNIYCYGEIAEFSPEYAIPKEKVALLREDILMAGHRSHGDPRTTFCASCNLHLISSFISQLPDGIHFVITGDSNDELSKYHTWMQDILKRTGLNKLDFKDLVRKNLEKVLNLREIVFRDIHGIKTGSGRFGDQKNGIEQEFEFISIFDFTDYTIKKHWSFFKDHIGFSLSENTLNFSESDCCHPLLMCHLRGLSAEAEGRGYNQGVLEYLELAEYLMDKKEFHEETIQQTLGRYSSPERIEAQRRKAEEFALNIGITKDQLVSIVYSPIAGKGENLERYIQDTAPEMLSDIGGFHEFLTGEDEVKPTINEFLFIATGLGVEELRHLYNSPLMYPLTPGKKASTDEPNPLELIRYKDPHKKRIRYENSSKEIVEEIISGR